jgi:hypothetical protein
MVAGSLFLLAAVIPVAGEERGAAAVNGSILLGEMVDDGVRANARIRSRQSEANRPMGTETVRIEVTLVSQETGKAIGDGVLTVQVIDPDRESELMPTPMTAEQDRFVADVTLAEPGNYRLRVSARLADNRTRSFDFAYTAE